MKIIYSRLRQDPYQSYKHHNFLNFKFFMLKPQIQEIKEFNPWQRSKSISWCRNRWRCCSLCWPLYFLHQYYMLSTSLAQLDFCYQSIERIRSGFSKIFAAKCNVLIYVPLLNMTSAAPLSVLLSFLSQRKEGKRGRSVSHLWKGYRDYNLVV